MANTTTEKAKMAEAAPLTAMGVIAPVVGWLIPGAGHMIQNVAAVRFIDAALHGQAKQKQCHN